jgi:hypothetical protein
MKRRSFIKRVSVASLVVLAVPSIVASVVDDTVERYEWEGKLRCGGLYSDLENTFYATGANSVVLIDNSIPLYKPKKLIMIGSNFEVK